MAPSSIATIVIAGAASNVGKTTIVCALAAACRARGLDVRPFKSGPDYLDPTWHEAACGRPARNLDTWMLDPGAVLRSFARGAAGGDLAIVEGSMGLFDGADPDSLVGSTAHLAKLLGASVVLVIDAGSMARSAAAVAEGFARHAGDVHVAGVICNRVGSPGHAALLRTAMAHAHGSDDRPLDFFGASPQDDRIEMPSRHLGLRAAGLVAGPLARDGTVAWRSRMADWAEEHLKIDALLARARARPVTVPVLPSSAPAAPRTRIGIARDEAFHFYYRDNLDLLAEAGAELVEFSPLHDAVLPVGLDGLYFGGGYPEEHAAELAANASMLAAVRALAERHGPIYGECAGMMYLAERLTDRQGRPHILCGLLPLHTTMQDGLVGFGYRTVTLTTDCILGAVGTVFRGHEFHWSSLAMTGPADTCFASSWKDRRADEGFRRGSVLGTYLHAHWGSNPGSAAAFVRACAHRSGAETGR